MYKLELTRNSLASRFFGKSREGASAEPARETQVPGGATEDYTDPRKDRQT